MATLFVLPQGVVTNEIGESKTILLSQGTCFLKIYPHQNDFIGQLLSCNSCNILLFQFQCKFLPCPLKITAAATWLYELKVIASKHLHLSKRLDFNFVRQLYLEVKRQVSVDVQDAWYPTVVHVQQVSRNKKVDLPAGF
jgi:hypothetical protein